jgi:hypothetical protein
MFTEMMGVGASFRMASGCTSGPITAADGAHSVANQLMSASG